MVATIAESTRFSLGVASQELLNADCMAWLAEAPPQSIHAVVTDPPFGIVEYTPGELAKRKAGQGGIWRIPPEIGGSKRAPLPRFTVLTAAQRLELQEFFTAWAVALRRVLRPGAHVIVASTTALHHTVFSAIEASGLENRGEIVRTVRTLRGGDRPKGAEQRFPAVASMLRSSWEPWGVFREPFDGTLAENLERWGTGGLGRNPDGSPLADIIQSTRTPKGERALAKHPSLKPQAFLRTVVRASLPLGEGCVLDPFAGAGSTIAAAAAVGYDAIGIEIDREFYRDALTAIPLLAAL